MRLVLLEHKKLWRRKRVKICVLLCFVYIVVFGAVLSYQWFTFGSVDDPTSAFGKKFDGHANIRDKQKYAAEMGGLFTDRRLQELVRDYQEKVKAGQEEDVKKIEYFTVNRWLQTLWPELLNPETPELMMDYVKPEQLTGFYERRQQKTAEFLEANGQDGAEKAYFMEMNAKVEEPFTYGWIEGWSLILGEMISGIGTVLVLFLAVILSPVFAGEWHDNTRALIASTKNGGRQLAFAKAGSGLLFTLEFLGLLTAGTVGAQLYFIGTNGWNMQVQFIKLIATAPVNMLEAEIYEYACVLLGALGYTGMVLLLSACFKSSYTALLVSLASVYVPMAIAGYTPLWMQKLFDLIPLAGSPADLFRTNVYHIFGKLVWSPVLILIVPFIAGMVCVPFAVKRWSGRVKA